MFRPIIENVLAHLARDRARRRAISELTSLNEHLLADAGILRADIPVLMDRVEAGQAARQGGLGRTGTATRRPAAFNKDLLTAA